MPAPPKTFLQKYQYGPPDRTIYEPYGAGFLCLKYGEDREIVLAAFVRKHGQTPDYNQGQLWFMLDNDMVTFKSESSLSGSYWSNGSTDMGTVFDDDLGGGPGKKCEMDPWIEECLKEMCLPGSE